MVAKAITSSTLQSLKCDALDLRADATSLDLSRKQLRAADAEILAAAMAKFMGSLTQINLADNVIGGYYQAGKFISTPEGAKAIAEAISISGSLNSINLCLNGIGPEGAKALAPAIRDSRSLNSIDLRNNYLGPEGAKALAPAIRDNGSLYSIDLSGNALGAEGAKALAPGVRDSRSLHSIELYDNDLGHDGDEIVQDALRYAMAIRPENYKQLACSYYGSLGSRNQGAGEYNVEWSQPLREPAAVSVKRHAGFKCVGCFARCFNTCDATSTAATSTAIERELGLLL